MKLEQLLQKYKTRYRIAKQFGFSTGTITNWGKLGYIPITAQQRICFYDNEFCLTINEQEVTERG